MRTLIVASALLAGAAFAKQLSPECLAELEFEYWEVMRAQQHSHAVCAEQPSQVDEAEAGLPGIAGDTAEESTDSEGEADPGS